MLTLYQLGGVESEYAKYRELVDKYSDTRERVAFSIEVDLREYDESPKHGVVAKIGDKVLYQYETDNEELARELAVKMGW